MNLSLPELVWSSDRREWARHPGFLASPEKIERIIQIVRNQGFNRVAEVDLPRGSTRVVDFPTSPIQVVPACILPKNRRHNEIVSLVMYPCEDNVRIGAGFLRYADRWYFSQDGDNFVRDFFVATLWKDLSLSSSSAER